MIVTETSQHVFRVEMTQQELYTYMVIVTGMSNLQVSNVSEAIGHILTYCSDRCYSTIKEPETNGTPRA